MHLGSAKTCEHEANHRQIDHGFAGLGLSFVIPVESTVTAQPTKGALDDPAPRQHFEGVQFRALHDLDRAAPQLAAPLQQGAGVAAIGPDMLDAAPWRFGEEGRQQLLGAVAILNVGWQHQHPQKEAHRVDQNVPLATLDFLTGVVTALVTAFGTLDALAVDDRGAGMALALRHQAHQLPQMRVNGYPQSIFLPEPKVVIDRTPGSKVRGQIAPLAAGFVEIENRVEQLPIRMLAGPSLFAGLR